jgi:hypothetical protein
VTPDQCTRWKLRSFTEALPQQRYRHAGG